MRRPCLSYFTPFTGREDELKGLNLRLDEALNYNGGFVLVSGETGIGKTRLLRQFSQEIRDRDIHVLTGRVIKDESKPFSPFTRMLEHFFLDISRDRAWIAKFLAPQIAAHLINLMPEISKLYPVDLPEPSYPVDMLSLIYTFQRLFDDLSKSRPLVIILNDIQWMAEESIQLLKFLVDHIQDQPILLVAAVRSDSGSNILDEAIDKMNTTRLVQKMDLKCFSLRETENCLCSKFGGNLSTPFVEWLYGITKGNPLYVEEILKTLVRQNIIYKPTDSGVWFASDDYADFSIPETVESVIHYRLGNTTDRELDLLQGAAVIGESFNLETVQPLLQSYSEADLRNTSQNLINSGTLIDNQGTLQFAHPLIHAVLHREINKEKRRTLHRRLAGILKETGSTDEDVLPHLLLDLLPSEETAELSADLFHTAESIAENSYNYLGAQAYLQTALEIAKRKQTPIKQRLKIQTELFRLSWVMGMKVSSIKEMEAFADKLIQNTLFNEAVTVFRTLFHTALSNRDMERADQILNRGISLLTRQNPLYWTLAVEHCLLQRRRGLLEESELEAEKLSKEIPGDLAPEALYKVFKNMGLVSFLNGSVNQAEAYLKKAGQIVEEQHLLLYKGDSLSNLALAEMTRGNITDALKKLNEAGREMELLNRKLLLGVNFLYSGTCFKYLGEYEKAIRAFDKSFAIAQELNNYKLKYCCLLNKSRSLFLLGEIDSAESILADIPTDKVSRQILYDFKLLQSELLLQRNDSAGAMEIINEALAIAEELDLGTKYGIAAGIKARILMEMQMKSEAYKWLDISKENLQQKGEVPCMAEILVNFGLAAGDTSGEEILIEGLEMLFIMGAQARIRKLSNTLHKEFRKAADLISDSTRGKDGSRIEVTTFGGLSVTRTDDLKPLAKKAWHSRVARELFALILVQSGSQGITREIAAFHLWPDAPEKKAQANLRVSLTHANSALGGDAITSDGPFLRINRNNVNTDFLCFEEHANHWRELKNRGKPHPAEDRARKALDLYKGHFLPEFYSTPLLDKQDELEGTRREMLLWLASRSMDKCEWNDAAQSARQLLISDSCNELACTILMRSLVNKGDRIAALRQYERLRKNLKQEFNTEPGPEISEFHRQISI